MQKIGQQISIHKNGNESKVEIQPLYSSKDKTGLIMWLVAWTFCGLAVLSQLFFDYAKAEKVMMLIYLVFWLYFELKVLYAFRWQKAGKEVIEIKNGSLFYTQLIGQRGLPVEYKLTEIKYFKFMESAKKGFFNDLNQSIWMVAGETVEFEVNGSLKRLGLKLSESDAKKLADWLNKQL